MARLDKSGSGPLEHHADLTFGSVGSSAAEGGPLTDTTIAAIDFETATAQRGSACAVGVAVSQGDGTVRGRSWLIQPPGNEYADMNISIHGIRPSDTADSPTIVEVWPEVADYIGDRILVAHNASFDMSVLRQSFYAHESLIPDEYTYLCTYLLAKLVWPERWSYRLPDILSDLGLDTSQHHSPAWDAYAALEVGSAIAQDMDVDTLRHAAESQGLLLGRLYRESVVPEFYAGGAPSAGRAGGSRKTSDIVPTTDRLDPDHPFYGMRIVITGGLPNGMPRRDAYQRVVNLGGEVADSVSKKVNILVCSHLHLKVSGERRRSGKLDKAVGLAESGVDIELMDATDFLQLLGS